MTFSLSIRPWPKWSKEVFIHPPNLCSCNYGNSSFVLTFSKFSNFLACDVCESPWEELSETMFSQGYDSSLGMMTVFNSPLSSPAGVTVDRLPASEPVRTVLKDGFNIILLNF